MSKGERGTPVGSASFWDMSELAMAGKLASCQSCVEFWYLQSQQNAIAFLDSCSAAGLVERVSLIDLHGDLESIGLTGPTLRQGWYDQAIYVSAPGFRKQNLDEARDRIEGTKNAVYEAFHLYFEILGANDEAISKAYLKAVAEERLRHSNVAKERLDVDLSAVAKLRLIKDGYKSVIGKQNPTLSRSQVDRVATDQAVSFIVGHSGGAPVSSKNLSDRAEEIEGFIFEFLGDPSKLQPLWQGDEGTRLLLFLFPVVNELVRMRVNTFKAKDDATNLRRFEKSIREKIHKAQKRKRKHSAYLAALEELTEDLDNCIASLAPLVPTITQYGTEARI